MAITGEFLAETTKNSCLTMLQAMRYLRSDHMGKFVSPMNNLREGFANREAAETRSNSIPSD